MTATDPDALQALARVLHEVFCRPDHRYTPAHERQDLRRAETVSARFRAAGLTHI